MVLCTKNTEEERRGRGKLGRMRKRGRKRGELDLGGGNGDVWRVWLPFCGCNISRKLGERS